MAEFAYNNSKNINTGYTPFKLNYRYYSCIFYKENVNPCPKSKLTDELSIELKKLITIYWRNFHHTQKLQKWAHNKTVKSSNYVSSNKIWLNSRYIKTKQNQKLKTKFFGPFYMFYLVGKQVYKLKLLKW